MTQRHPVQGHVVGTSLLCGSNAVSFLGPVSLLPAERANGLVF